MSMNTRDDRVKPVVIQDNETESELVGRLIREAVRLTSLYQLQFEGDFKRDFMRRNGGRVNVELKYSLWHALSDQEPMSLLKAVESLITSELVGGFASKFGASAVSLRFRVKSGAQEIIDAQKPKRKKAKKKEIEPAKPLGPIVSRRREMEKEMLDMQPRGPWDDEPGMTFELAGEALHLMTAVEVDALMRRKAEERSEAAEARSKAEKEFLGPPEPCTAEFDFIRLMAIPEDRGEKVFVQPKIPAICLKKAIMPKFRL